MIPAVEEVAIGWRFDAPLGREQEEALASHALTVLAEGQSGVVRLDASEAGWESAKRVCMAVLAGELRVNECRVTIRQTMIPHWESFRLRGWVRDGGYVEFRRVAPLPGVTGGTSGVS